MHDYDLEHPDITAALLTGYPNSIWEEEEEEEEPEYEYLSD